MVDERDFEIGMGINKKLQLENTTLKYPKDQCIKIKYKILL